ncbi:hypothetical protein VP1G_11094 [Cytospora mali]|uniref:Carcinoembryonic antigen-related cell adhesion molecule 1 n=1 Tax=Cytospora mali TaxID=578113 RepID=A0A194V6Y2_CYTMA|nr:hypothetical protein VP1G_11094 [Valsa mali var. pyri (nom. inval.)]
MCYNDNHTTTYMAGCTDPTFGASECPSKDHSDQQLLGLTQCDGTDTSDGNVLWSGCPGPATRTVLGQPSVCSCSGTADGLLYAPTSIAAVASLPTKVGETISFKKGHTPSLATAGSSVTTSVDGHSTILASTPAPTSTSDSSSGVSEAEALSTGAKAGVGIGAAALGLAALGLILWFATWSRRRHAEKSREEKGSPDHPTSPDQHELAILQQPTPGYYYPSEAGSTTGSVPPSYNSPKWPASAG